MGAELPARDLDAGAISSAEPAVRRRCLADDWQRGVAHCGSSNRACNPVYVARHHADE
jgi:hypothetical protein